MPMRLNEVVVLGLMGCIVCAWIQKIIPGRVKIAQHTRGYHIRFLDEVYLEVLAVVDILVEDNQLCMRKQH
jgi:hypothetical protein